MNKHKNGFIDAINDLLEFTKLNYDDLHDDILQMTLSQRIYYLNKWLDRIKNGEPQ